jgi:hypothetical protein
MVNANVMATTFVVMDDAPVSWLLRLIERLNVFGQPRARL